MADAQTFVDLKPLLFSIAYRMLGSVTEAEDVLQDAYLRWHQVPQAEVESARSFLAAVVTRLCIDRLRSARARRETYVGPWLPEPLLTEAAPDVAEEAELADSISMAFLVLLESLTPLERAALLLREVFGFGYDEIARILDRSEEACRQLVSRGRKRLGDPRPRFEADPRRRRELTEQFRAAVGSGDLAGLLELLAEDAVAWSDAGGRVAAARRPIVGAQQVARFLLGSQGAFPRTWRSGSRRSTASPASWPSRRPALHRDRAGDGRGRIHGLRIVVNPTSSAGWLGADPVVALPDVAARRERSSSHPATVQEPPHLVLWSKWHPEPSRCSRAASGLRASRPPSNRRMARLVACDGPGRPPGRGGAPARRRDGWSCWWPRRGGGGRCATRHPDGVLLGGCGSGEPTRRSSQ
jgi:RNA polymerase sigma-70 factor (ECF subfamily)